jgi:predicted permease
VAALLVIGGWLSCRLWLSTVMKRLLKLDSSARSSSAIAARFAASDLMPGFIVYPFLMGCISKGSPNRVGIALHVLMFRIYGGCRRVASGGGRLPQAKPVAGGRDMVLKLPRGVLSDMALVGNPAGRCLIRIAEPDNPAWKRDPNDREVQIARRHLAERTQSDN